MPHFEFGGQMSTPLLGDTAGRPRDVAPNADYWTILVMAAESDTPAVRDGIAKNLNARSAYAESLAIASPA
jgi:hypothetical protein